jgi:hypothetical protein
MNQSLWDLLPHELQSEVESYCYIWSKFCPDRKMWCISGKKHRDNNLPAMIYNNSDKYWYVNGNRHRENDLPTVI